MIEERAVERGARAGGDMGQAADDRAAPGIEGAEAPSRAVGEPDAAAVPGHAGDLVDALDGELGDDGGVAGGGRLVGGRARFHRRLGQGLAGRREPRE
jgi:hypothetical protein